MLHDDEVERVVVVAAHPDDVEMRAAGTVAHWTARGITVTYCICSDGEAGGFDLKADRAEVARVRRAEQVSAAAAVGVRDVRFLGYPDGLLEPTIELRRDISRIVRSVRPQRMVSHSTERDWQRLGASHPDHLAAGVAAIAAIYPDAGNPFAHPQLLHDEGLQPWRVDETWLMGHPTKNHHVDITDVFTQKLAALRCHVSQNSHILQFDERLRARFGAVAVNAGLPHDRLAEGFMVVRTNF